MIKNTKKLSTVLKIIKLSDTPITASDIFYNASKEIKINLSTIYRILKRLEEENLITKTLRQDKKFYYELKHNYHKHFLICRICHDVEPVEHCPLENMMDKIKEQTGFEITAHTLEIEGICKKCKNN